MASAHSYGITKLNNITEKEALLYLLRCDKRFIQPDRESRKHVLKLLGLNKRFSRAFDVVLVRGRTRKDSLEDLRSGAGITLVELKTTKEYLPKNPDGFFFGATENEFTLARRLKNRYKFCFVCLHPKSRSFVLLTTKQLEKKTLRKRRTYQIDLKY